VCHELTKDFVMPWKATGLMLTENQLAIVFDIEDSAGTCDEFRFDSFRIFDCGRQTDGFRRVVSYDAIDDLDSHTVVCLSHQL